MKVIFPGSFDPITKGHENIIRRVIKIFGSIEILILNNFNKNHMLSIYERKNLISLIFKDDDRIKITTYDGLLADYVSKNNIDIIIRAVRNLMDFENEKINAKINKDLSNIETLILFSEENETCISSSMVKDVYFSGGNILKYVSIEVLEILNNKFRRNT